MCRLLRRRWPYDCSQRPREAPETKKIRATPKRSLLVNTGRGEKDLNLRPVHEVKVVAVKESSKLVGWVWDTQALETIV